MAYVTPQTETLEAKRLISSYTFKNQNNILLMGQE
jgi:hypothetical protein